MANSKRMRFSQILIITTVFISWTTIPRIWAHPLDFTQFVSAYLPDGIYVDGSGNVYVTSVNPDDVFQEYLTKYSAQGDVQDRAVFDNTGRLQHNPQDGKIWMLSALQFYRIDPDEMVAEPFLNLDTLVIDNDQIYDVATEMPFMSNINPNAAFYRDFAFYDRGESYDVFVAGFYQAWHFILRLRFADESVQSAKIIVTSGAALAPEDSGPHGVAVNDAGVVMTTLGRAGNAANTDQPVTFSADYPEDSNNPPDYLFDEYQSFTSRGMATDQHDQFYVATGWVGGGTAGGGNSCIIALPPELDTTFVYAMESIYANPRDVCVDRQSGLVYCTDSDMDFFGDHDAVWFMPIVTGINQESAGFINQFTLLQNYPNPFNNATTLEYSVPQLSEITIVIYNLKGQQVAQLVNTIQPPGIFRTTWDGSGFPSGVYYCACHIDREVKMIKLLLMK